MGAKVVFANGSKQMAHNLDDLYQRWMMRHDELIQAPSYEDSSLEIFLPDLPEITSREQAASLKVTLQEKLILAYERIIELEQQQDQ